MKHTTITHRFTAMGRHQRGASLLEAIAYLGIAAIVILGAISLLTGAFSSAQSNRLGEEAVSIRTGVKKLYMGQANSYGAASMNATLAAARVFPATVNTTVPATPTNAFGGTVAVLGIGSTFSITYTLVPQDVCIGALSGASGWVSVKGTGTIQNTFPLSPANATTTCTAGTNTMVWISR
ncbi:MAG: hypothetical protein ACI8WM_000545 [Burkholderiaceae bacterium]|jgi:hypothetical protein